MRSIDPERATLQYLAMHGIGETAELERATETSDVGSTLSSLQSDGYVEEEGFWYLTDAGEDRLDELCRERFSADERQQLQEIFDDFEALDARFKALSEEWQQTEDAKRRGAILEQLEHLHTALVGLFDELGDEPRAVYEQYLDRLASAANRISEGESEYFTGADVDSYHTIWFELHDDLLRTLGRDREE